MQHPKPDRLALLALFTGAVAIGFAPVLVRLSQVGPSAAGFYRVLLALPFLWLLPFLGQRNSASSVQPSTFKDFALLAAAGLLFALDLGVWHWSLKFTTVANSTLLTNIAPIFVTIGAWIFFKDRITSRFVLGMFLAAAGATTLVKTSAQVSSGHVLGDTLACITAIFYAAYVLLMKQLRNRFSPGVIMAWSSLVSCPLLFITGWLMDDSFTPPDRSAWIAIIGLAIIPHVGGQTLIAYALGKLSASLTSSALFLQPVIAAFLAWILLEESLTWLQTLGGITAIAGVTIATRVGPAITTKK